MPEPINATSWGQHCTEAPRRYEGWCLDARAPGVAVSIGVRYAGAVTAEGDPCRILTIRDGRGNEWRRELLQFDDDEPPWASLDLGIVLPVMLLFDAGLRPTDSGDGNKAHDMECALPFPHVFIPVPVGAMVARANAAMALDWQSIGWPTPKVEVSYSPNDGRAILSVMWPPQVPWAGQESEDVRDALGVTDA